MRVKPFFMQELRLIRLQLKKKLKPNHLCRVMLPIRPTFCIPSLKRIIWALHFSFLRQLSPSAVPKYCRDYKILSETSATKRDGTNVGISFCQKMGLKTITFRKHFTHFMGNFRNSTAFTSIYVMTHNLHIQSESGKDISDNKVE